MRCVTRGCPYPAGYTIDDSPLCSRCHGRMKNTVTIDEMPWRKPVDIHKRLEGRRSNYRTDGETIRRIRQMYAKGTETRIIADELRISRTTVRKYCTEIR